MIARMPDCEPLTRSSIEKPRRPSISSWLRMRSAPPLEPCPSSSIEAHSLRTSSPPTPCSASAAPQSAARSSSGCDAPPCSARAAPHSAIRSWSAGPAISLHHDLFEQHRVDLGRVDRDVDAPRQLLLQPEEAGRSLEVGGAELAHIGLKGVEHARHHRLDVGADLLLADLERDLHLQILRPILRIE